MISAGSFFLSAAADSGEVTLDWLHGARRLRVRNKEHVLVRRTRKRDPALLENETVGAIASCYPYCPKPAGAAVKLPERDIYVVGILFDRYGFCIPLYVHAKLMYTSRGHICGFWKQLKIWL
ncbi:hypothetical protein SAMN05421882_10775 [Nitrosomonas communis]|uniref:Uncharacterized protein n=1 Tax=Nitrosomonas communis TaxID=44574 RepID=A0A1H2ZHS5_9PROT|nr:hypothetical protein SAMN05421882_10775 [Nitrosomonas communis]